MRCPYCRSLNQEYAAFCLECGEILRGQAGAALNEEVGQTTRGAGLVARLWACALRVRARSWAVLGVGALLVALAAGAAGVVTQQARVDSYRAGLIAEAGGQWDAAAADYTSASGYRDAAERGRAAKSRAAARMAAVGLIYAREAGPGAGLYLQGPLDSPAVALPNTDAASHVLAFSPDGTMPVYDGPTTDGGRGLYLATLAPALGRVGDVRLLPAALSVADGWGKFYPGGLWWFSTVTPTLSYYDLNTASGGLVSLPVGQVLLNEDAGHGLLLLTEAYSGPDGVRSHLLIAGADGRNQRIVGDSTGLIRTAEFSPDARSALYTSEELWAKPGALRTSLVFLPIGGQQAGVEAERVLDRIVLPDDAPSGGGITAHFAPDLPACVVANRNDSAGRLVTIYDEASATQTSFRPAAPPSDGLAGPFFSPRGGYLLLEERTPTDLRLTARPLAAGPASARRVVPLQVPDNTLVLGQISLRDDYLLYLMTHPGSGRAREEYSLYRVPLGAGTAGGTALKLFSAVYSPSLFNQPAITLAPGGTLLAYIRPDKTLIGLPLTDGTAIPLATGVRDVWSPLP
ncbi:MAG: hypothetical protein ACR2M0_15935 [Chloroflexia bacterium]